MQEQLEARIKELSAQIKERNEELGNAMQQLAEMQTDLKIGDRITWDRHGSVYELAAIKPWYGKEPKLFGMKIKKDGTPGKLWQTLYIPYGKQIVKVSGN